MHGPTYTSNFVEPYPASWATRKTASLRRLEDDIPASYFLALILVNLAGAATAANVEESVRSTWR